MAYQNVGTPRFYIDIFSWLKSLGLAHEYGRSRFGLDTSEQEDDDFKQILFVNGNRIIPLYVDYFAILGHEMSGHPFNGKFADDPWTQEYYISNYTVTERINCSGGGGDYYTPSYNGFSIVRFSTLYISDSNVTHFYYASTGEASGETHIASTFSLGKTYTMPHSPELKLTMTREMDGVKRVRTPGGVDLVDHKYTKSPPWGDAAPWELYSGTPTYQALSRSGRRTWSLSFNALMKNDMFASVNSLTTFGNSEYTEADDDYPATSNTLLYSDTFYSQVIHKTNGGQLPFIFQPNKDDNTEFAICKLDMKSFKFKMVANEIFNIQIKIKEIW